MNRKLFKRLLIATSMIVPVAMITPMILTSCNDTNQSGKSGVNGITLVTSNSLLKESKSFINPNNNVFWLNIIDDTNEFYYKGENKELTEFGKLYEKIVKSTSIDFLLDEGYEKFAVEGSSNNENISIYKKLINNENDPWVKSLNDLKLNNFKLENINWDIKPDEEMNDNLGVGILGSEIKLADLIGQNKVDVNSYIKLVNKDFPDTKPIDANSLHKSYNYEFVYSIKPKDGYYWNGIDPTTDKSKQPLEIRVSDYINDILFIDNLNDFQSDDANKVFNFTGNADNLTLGIDIDSSITTVELFVAEIKKNLGLEEQSKPKSRATTPITWSENTNLEKVFDLFLKADSSGVTKINGTKKGETTNNYPLKLNNIIINNLSEAFKKNRVKLSAEVTKDSTDQNKVVATIEIKLNDLGASNGYFEWLLKDKGITTYSNNKIIFKLNWTFNAKNN